MFTNTFLRLFSSVLGSKLGGNRLGHMVCLFNPWRKGQGDCSCFHARGWRTWVLVSLKTCPRGLLSVFLTPTMVVGVTPLLS